MGANVSGADDVDDGGRNDPDQEHIDKGDQSGRERGVGGDVLQLFGQEGQQRIDKGVSSGKLNAKEAARLQKGQTGSRR